MAIPKKVKEDCMNDPRYKRCALFGLHGHVCAGRITWEHALIYAGKQIQEKWAIVPLCERAHAVNSFQDAGTMKKELNVWLALNQATESDFERFPRAFPSYHEQKIRLNRKYGVPNLSSEVIEY
jgi:hypothetical protein